MAIGIYGIRFTPPFQEPVRCLLDTLKSAGHELRVHERFHPFVSEALPSCADLPTFKDLSAFPEMNLLISIGGDGTLLDTVRIVRDSGIPVLGVNTGRLGFLSLFNLEEPEARRRGAAIACTPPTAASRAVPPVTRPLGCRDRGTHEDACHTAAAS